MKTKGKQKEKKMKTKGKKRKTVDAIIFHSVCHKTGIHFSKIWILIFFQIEGNMNVLTISFWLRTKRIYFAFKIKRKSKEKQSVHVAMN